jgi:hypothetical protein
MLQPRQQAGGYFSLGSSLQEVNLDSIWLAWFIKAKCGNGLVAIMCNNGCARIATSKES